MPERAAGNAQTPKPANVPATERLALDVRRALKQAIAQLRLAQVGSPVLAAELLLMKALGCDRTWLYTYPESPIDPYAAAKFHSYVARRSAGEPTQYITGKQEFWGLEFEVTPAVLIPRPETEHVVEVALERLGGRGIKINMKTGAPSPALRVADVGTGSGCLAVALAWELPHAKAIATDISPAALQVAARNAMRHQVADRVDFVECDLLSGISAARGSFDLIVSNPPYVAESEEPELQREVRDHEPRTALFGGPTGVEVYARLIEQASALLGAGCCLVVEIGFGAADQVRHMLQGQPDWVNVSVTNDLAGIPRVIAAERA